MKKDQKTPSILGSPVVIHGFEWTHSHALLFGRSLELHYIKLLSFYSSFHFLSLYFISLLPKTLCLGKHSFDCRGKRSHPCRTQDCWEGNIPKMSRPVGTLLAQKAFLLLILFPKCSSSGISCARIFFLAYLPEIS